MAQPAYIDISIRKWEKVSDLIPAAWRLDDKYIPRAMRLSPSDSVYKLDQFGDGYETNLLDVPRNCRLLSAREVRITEAYDIKGLLNEIAERRLSAEEVALAFCKVRYFPPISLLQPVLTLSPENSHRTAINPLPNGATVLNCPRSSSSTRRSSQTHRSTHRPFARPPRLSQR